MEISIEALAKIVSATRQAMFVDETLRMLGTARHGESVPEKVAGDLMDVLFELSGEVLDPGQDFINDSKTAKLVLNHTIPTEQVALALKKMNKQSIRIPPPKFYSRQEIENFLETGGGYGPDYGYRPSKDVIDDDIG